MAQPGKPDNPWTTTEHRIVETICPTWGTRAAYQALGGKRTLDAVKMYAFRAGIRIPGRKPASKISSYDVADLRNDVRREIRWPGMSHMEIAKALGVAKYAVQHHIYAGKYLPPDDDE